MRIEWSDHAVSDLKAISEYIEQDRSLDTANRVARGIYNAIRSLRDTRPEAEHKWTYYPATKAGASMP